MRRSIAPVAPDAVVGALDFDRVRRRSARRRPRSPRAGMLERVRERLLRDPVDRQVERGRHAGAAPLEAHRHVEPGRSHLLGQGFEIRRSRLGGEDQRAVARAAAPRAPAASRPAPPARCARLPRAQRPRGRVAHRSPAARRSTAPSSRSRCARSHRAPRAPGARARRSPPRTAPGCSSCSSATRRSDSIAAACAARSRSANMPTTSAVSDICGAAREVAQRR